MAWNRICCVAALSLTFIFSACGGDSGNSVDSFEKIEIVSSIDKLGDCTRKLEGDTIFVKEVKVDFVCLNGEWVNVDSLDTENSYDKKLSSSTIIESSSAENIDAKSSDSHSSSSVSSRDSSVYDSLPVFLIKDKSISGVSQKGPFVKGSSVTMQELDGETLAQTGKSFKGKISSDKGEFSVSNISLVSQYAILEATGYYRNEVSGSKSIGTITLNALTDLSNRKKVNINLLTHLEYERALYLVGTGFNVSEAKKQAESEILAAFEISGDFVNSEDLEIFGNEDGNAALLAFSILMLGNRGEADLTELLTNFATDIEKDGVWNDSVTKADIADWAEYEDLSGGLSIIRSNIETWKLGIVPDFEKYIRNFWYSIYGLEECTKDREGEVAAVQNKFSVKFNSKERYICKSGAWTIASDIEKDTYSAQKLVVKDADAQWGDVNSTRCYVFDKHEWRLGGVSDCSLGLGGCTTLRQNTVVKGNDLVWYTCDTKSWRYATTYEKDVFNWTDSADGSIKKGNVTDTVYIFDKTAWREASDVEVGLGGCVDAIKDSIGKVGDIYYICTPRMWVVATELQYDTYKHNCSEFGQIVHGMENTGYAYFCDGKYWKRFYGNESLTYEKMVDNRDNQIYRTVKIGGQTWMAENLNFADTINHPSLSGKAGCYDWKQENCDKYGRLYTWSIAMDSAGVFSTNGKGCGFHSTCSPTYPLKGICPDGWHLPQKEEFETLISFINKENIGGGEVLKSAKEWNGGVSGIDSYGFSALPAGFCKTHSQPAFEDCFDERNVTAFWSASFISGYRDEDLYVAYALVLENSGNDVQVGELISARGYSVRCVKDDE